jgi:hypothetical protein
MAVVAASANIGFFPTELLRVEEASTERGGGTQVEDIMQGERPVM